MERPELLLLIHRIPYPPNKGDKIRSFHLLEYLSQYYRIHLATFIDDRQDVQFIPELDQYCESVCTVTINPTLGRIQSLLGFIKRLPLSVCFYQNPQVENYVRGHLQRGVERVVVFSSAMARFVLDEPQPYRLVADIVDVDSDKWQQYASRRSGIMKFVYQREAKRLLDWERKVANKAAATVLVSDNECKLFKKLIPEMADRYHPIPNGVDSSYFSPDPSLENPYSIEAPVLVFTGAMDYWANVDAVEWFVQEVMPLIWEDCPEVQFCIVGSNPTSEVKALGQLDGVLVTGRVPDVRPYLQHATVSVAPLRIARGIQNKVLEAMAMGRPVVASHPAMHGLENTNDFEPLINDEAMPMANAIKALLGGSDGGGHQWGKLGREYVERHYNWPTNLSRFSELIEGPASSE